MEIADTILQSMDPKVDPCQDFYKFACGNYLKTTVLPSNKVIKSQYSQWNTDISKMLFDELEAQSLEGQPKIFQKAKDFYQSCLDTETIETIGLDEMRERLRYYGRWPVLETDTDENSGENWMETMRRIAENGHSYNMIVSLGVGPNDMNVSQSILQVGQPETGIGRLLLTKGVDDPIVKAYYKEMVEIAVEFGADKRQAELQMRECLHFEIQLAEILAPPGDLRDVEKVTRFMMVSELQTKYPSIDWLYLFNSVMGDIVKPASYDYVEVYSSSFLDKLEPLLRHTSDRVLSNYIMWRVVYSIRRYLTRSIEQIDDKLLQLKDGVTSPLKRRRFCLLTTNSHLGGIVGAAYVRKHFTQHSKEKALELAKLFQKQLITMIMQVDWLDFITKKRALRKVKLIKFYVGYPDELADDNYLEHYYDKLTINSSDFLGNVLSIGRFRREIELRRLHKPFNISAWDIQGVSSVFGWNAYYTPNDNSISLFSGMLRGYTFDADRPLIFNIVTAGSVIGHELTHSVDDLGAEFDEFGNLHDWWESDTKKTFREKANNIVKVYSSYLVKEVNMTIHAKNMQGEIIADEGGVKLAYMALEEQLSRQARELRLRGLEDYSTQQIYWLGHSVTECMKIRPEILKQITEEGIHPPGEVRVNGPLRNFHKFSEAWGCANGSYMNPAVKVNVW